MVEEEEGHGGRERGERDRKDSGGLGRKHWGSEKAFKEAILSCEMKKELFSELSDVYCIERNEMKEMK